MKRFALVGLSIICLSLAATTSVKAGSRTERMAMSTQIAPVATIGNTQPTPSILSIRSRTKTGLTAMSTTAIDNDTANTKLTPFGLVSLAYQGEYRTQGIPGFGSFQSAISSKKITAQDLVKAAIDTKQLTPDTQGDIGYLNAVEQQLTITRN